MRRCLIWAAIAATALGAGLPTGRVGAVAPREQLSAPIVAAPERDEAIEALASKLSTGYVLPDHVDAIVRALQNASAAGDFDGKTPRDFVDSVNRTLRAASHDKHLNIYYQPSIAASSAGSPAMTTRERQNFGFNKLERLRGNVGYLEILNFTDLRPEATGTASGILSTLANFDALILDVRRNGGGNTPMMAYVASYFFDPPPVHLTDIYWRDTNQTSEFWTTADIAGRRSARQPLYLLTSVATFSSAEDFCYSLQQTKRATVVGETTGGGAHSGRGLLRLSPSFTAFVPVGRSMSPITKTNWEGVGVVPDIPASADAALGLAHLRALEVLADAEKDPQWKQVLLQAIVDLSK